MNVTYTEDGLFYIHVEGDSALELTRIEAEELFVSLGHMLQDHDVYRFNETGDNTECPTTT